MKNNKQQKQAVPYILKASGWRFMKNSKQQKQAVPYIP